jgi:hypothetical protein
MMLMTSGSSLAISGALFDLRLDELTQRGRILVRHFFGPERA